MKISILPQFILEFFRIWWLSLTSVKFYQALYKHYKGFGFKFLLMVMSLTSVIFMSMTYASIQKISNSLANSENSSLNDVLIQVPSMEYKAGKLFYDGDPLIITDKKGRSMIIVDPEGKLSAQNKEDTAIIFAKKQLIINVNFSVFLGSRSIDYEDLIGLEERVVDYHFIKDFIVNKISSMNILFIALATILMIFISSASHIMSNLFWVFACFAFLLMIGLRPSIQSAFRITMFTTASPILVIILLTFLTQNVSLVNKISIFLTFWPIFLASYSLTRRR